MLGAYFSWQVMNFRPFWLISFLGALGVSIVGLFLRGLLNRVYNAELLIQILLSYSIVLILDD